MNTEIEQAIANDPKLQRLHDRMALAKQNEAKRIEEARQQIAAIRAELGQLKFQRAQVQNQISKVNAQIRRLELKRAQRTGPLKLIARAINQRHRYIVERVGKAVIRRQAEQQRAEWRKQHGIPRTGINL